MATNRALRFIINVDDQHHTLPDGKVLMVMPYRQATRTPAGAVEVWIEVATPETWPDADWEAARSVQVFGTGHPLPEGAAHLGSCLDGPLVWHVYELEAQP